MLLLLTFNEITTTTTTMENQSMHIYLKNIPAKCHPDLIWNDGALGTEKRITQKQQDE